MPKLLSPKTNNSKSKRFDSLSYRNMPMTNHLMLWLSIQKKKLSLH